MIQLEELLKDKPELGFKMIYFGNEHYVSFITRTGKDITRGDGKSVQESINACLKKYEVSYG